MTAFGLFLAWEMASWISGGSIQKMVYVFLGGLVCVIGGVIIQSWRSGFYMFLVWVIFEDLARKYMGNAMAIYFGKDALVILIYISLFLAIRRHKENVFRPQFLMPLVIMIWFAVIQAFNPYSPHPLYGALGLKVDFLYAGLMFVSYALLRTDEDIRKFLTVSMLLAATVSVLGIIQSVVGPQFLNPSTLAPEIRELAQLEKYSPISHEVLHLPSSVFVSSSRYASFMQLATMLGLGASGYMLLHNVKGRKIIWMCLGVVATGVVVSGARGALVLSATSAVVMSAAFIWGAPWRTGQVHRMLRAIRRSALIIGASIFLIAVVYPAALGGKIAYYQETLTPGGEYFQVSDRMWDYPLYNLELAFMEPHWVTGVGTGTATLGGQYVAKYLDVKPLGLGVESGYGIIDIEFGVFGLALWLAWTGTLVFYCWRNVQKLRQTRMFPLGFMAFWYAAVLLFPQTFTTMNAFQDYVVNAYLWLLVGMLFRLPEILAAGPVAVPPWSEAASGRQ